MWRNRHVSFIRSYSGVIVKFISSVILIFLSIHSQAFNDFQVGDVILLDLDCRSCQIIEDESKGRFSHSGVVISDGKELFAAQSLGFVHHMPVKKFLKYTDKYVVVRPTVNTESFKKYHWDVYKSEYYMTPFDSDYRWDDQTLYCSEFLFKFMDSFMNFKDLTSAPMDFTRNWDYWASHFRNGPPQDIEGISPNDFYRTSDFKVIYDSQK